MQSNNAVGISGRLKAVTRQFEISCCYLKCLEELDLPDELSNSMVIYYFEDEDEVALNELVNLQHQHPRLKIILSSEVFSESLAIWALRSRIYDYVIYPSEYNYLLKLFEEFFGGQLYYVSPSKSVFDLDLELQCAHSNTDLHKKRTFAAQQYIDKYFSEKIKISYLAQLCFMSPDYFSRVFKLEFNITPQEYIKQKRLNKAKALLRESTYTIQQKSYQVGYSNQSQFNLLFKQSFSLTPNDFRNIAE